jgi:broad specificity phosphatase PhoE
MILPSLLAAMVLSSAVAAQEAVYVIRHAEKELIGDDPSITQEGQARAAAWAEMLLTVELDVVFTSNAKRTQETGNIIANILGLPTHSVDRADTTGLIDILSFDHGEDTVLVVGHAETIPGILEGFGAFNDIEISQTDFANLFILHQLDAGEPHLIRMRMPQANTP